jgi:hypothetical protein
MAAIIVCSLGITTIASAENSSTDFQKTQREMKAEHERRMAESKRLHEQTLRAIKSAQQSPSRPTSIAPTKLDSKPIPTRQTVKSTPAFNPASAPPPAECLKAYVATAKRVASLEPLLRYLPQEKQNLLKERQSQYDPKSVAKTREWHRKQGSKLDEASLTHITNAPYVNELQWHKNIAKDILKVLHVRIEDNKAYLHVSTTNDAVVNGVKYPYGTADIVLIGEENYWKFSSYDDGDTAYLHPPQPKQ